MFYKNQLVISIKLGLSVKYGLFWPYLSDRFDFKFFIINLLIYYILILLFVYFTFKCPIPQGISMAFLWRFNNLDRSI